MSSNWWTDRNESYFTPRPGDLEELESAEDSLVPWVDVDLVEEVEEPASAKEISEEDTLPGVSPSFFSETTKKVYAPSLVYLAVLEDARVCGDRVLEKLAVMALDGSLSSQDYVRMVFSQERAQA